VLQLVKNKNVKATIAHFSWSSDDHDDIAPAPEPASRSGNLAAATAGSKTVEEVTAHDLALLSTLQSSLSSAELGGRVSLTEVGGVSSAADALREVTSLAQQTVGQAPKNSGDLIVVGRRHGRLGDAGPGPSAVDLRRTVGVQAERLVQAGLRASLLVIQAGGRGDDS